MSINVSCIRSVSINNTFLAFVHRFHINLQSGEFEGCDIALHCNPRWDGWDKVVFNTFQNGEWEGEEKIREMPFTRGESFEMVIAVNSEGYQVRTPNKICRQHDERFHERSMPSHNSRHNKLHSQSILFINFFRVTYLSCLLDQCANCCSLKPVKLMALWQFTH